MKKIRLQKFLADAGLMSRRAAEEEIARGRVSVNGHPAEIGTQIDPAADLVTYKGKRVIFEKKEHVYIMMNKPDGLLSATTDKRQKTVVDLLPEHLRKRGLFPVGRLDKDTVGLILLTDDGPLGHELLSPKKHVDKVYLARVDGIIVREDVERLAEGMILEDGLHCLPAGLDPLGDGSECLVTLREGKYHQVKRMLAACGKPVTALKRLSMGPLVLDESLEPGQWRFLSRKELEELKNSTRRD